MKIKAFTILELTVITLLSAVVVGIAYTAFGIIYRQYNNYQKNAHVNLQVATLAYRLQKDFKSADSVVSKENGIICFEKHVQTSYGFEKEYIVRNKHLSNDTFYFSVLDFSMSLEQEPVSVPGLLVNEITFDVEFHGKKMPFRIIKQYAVADFINKASIK